MKKISIRHVLLLTVVGLTLGAVFVVSSVYSTTATTMFNQLGMSDMLQDMATVSDRLSTYVGRVRDVASAVAGDIEAEENFNAESFAQSVRFYTGNTEDISALILVDEYGTPIMGLPGAQFKETCNLPALDWYRQAMDAEIGETVLSRPHVQNLYPNSYPWVVSVLRKVRYNQDGEQNIGILMVDMRLEPLEEICRSVELGSSGCPYILSQDDEIIFHPDQKLLALELISEESIRTEEEDGADENTMVLSQDIAGTDWRLVGTVTAEDIAKNSSEFNSRMTGIVVCLAILVTAVAVWLSMQIVRPLTQMQTIMRRIERNLDDNRISLPEEGFAEYAALSHSYNVMLHKIRGLMKETVDRQEQLRRMEIGALQEQINPHFLYNTLDSIVRVMETGRTPEAIEMVQALGKLFRLSINNGDYFLTVEQEMDYARSYLTIQQVRYKKKFRYELHMDEEIRGALCPKIILQPLIENSIKHGMSEMPGCTLIVRAAQDEQGHRILFTVEDDGLGIPPEELSRLQEMLRDDSNAIVKKSRYGIGLRNTNRRIHLLYGEEYGLTIESEVEERTCVTITLPKRLP